MVLRKQDIKVYVNITKGRESGSIQRGQLNLAASAMWPGFRVMKEIGIKELEHLSSMVKESC